MMSTDNNRPARRFIHRPVTRDQLEKIKQKLIQDNVELKLEEAAYRSAAERHRTFTRAVICERYEWDSYVDRDSLIAAVTRAAENSGLSKAATAKLVRWAFSVDLRRDDSAREASQ